MGICNVKIIGCFVPICRISLQLFQSFPVLWHCGPAIVWYEAALRYIILSLWICIFRQFPPLYPTLLHCAIRYVAEFPDRRNFCATAHQWPSEKWLPDGLKHNVCQASCRHSQPILRGLFPSEHKCKANGRIECMNVVVSDKLC